LGSAPYALVAAEVSGNELGVGYGPGNDGDVTIDTDTDLGVDNVKYYDSLTVTTGVTLTANHPFIIYVADTLTLNGNIAVNLAEEAGGAGGSGNEGYDGGAGGQNGGTVFVFAAAVVGNGKVQANGGNGKMGLTLISGSNNSSGNPGDPGASGFIGDTSISGGGGGGVYSAPAGTPGSGVPRVSIVEGLGQMIREWQLAGTTDCRVYKPGGGGGGRAHTPGREVEEAAAVAAVEQATVGTEVVVDTPVVVEK
jgi:hypothetical protein